MLWSLGCSVGGVALLPRAVLPTAATSLLPPIWALRSFPLKAIISL